jgi:hypothetical protein
VIFEERDYRHRLAYTRIDDLRWYVPFVNEIGDEDDFANIPGNGLDDADASCLYLDVFLPLLIVFFFVVVVIAVAAVVGV